MISNDLYKCLSNDYKEIINNKIKDIKLNKGDILFWETEPANYVFYVKEGHIKVFKTSEEGQETIFSIYKTDMFVALGVLFNQSRNYPASGSSVDDSIIYALEVNTLEEAIVSSPNSARVWIGYLNHRLTTVQTMLSDQIFADGMQRLKKMIKYFYETYPSVLQGKYIKIQVPITKQEMAETLNIRRETLSRMLSSLKEDNICECTYKEIIVQKEWILN
ncbi:MAG: cyclic nucleotide-binding protein [Haloplasmataceae bacterium]|jgi:CRP/FNR family transcriptional regulator|nr:cyclic nucleotide-binding protein [Haloplasmataceae bacterium]